MTDKTWCVIINPAAGKGTAGRKWQRLRIAMDSAGLPYAEMETASTGHATILAKKAVDAGYQKFISIGGDGTHHEVVNGIVGHPILPSPLLAIVRAGTGNDLVRMHRVPTDPAHIVAMLCSGKSVPHDAGLIRCVRDGAEVSRYFINVAGMALDGRVVETFPAVYRRIPFLPGYLLAGVRQLLFYRAPAMAIGGDGHQLEGRYFTVHAGICKYSGDGMQFVPHADPSDGLLAITCVAQMPRFRLLSNVLRLYNSTLLAHPKVTSWKSQRLHVRSADGSDIPIEADGEFLGYTPLSIEIVPSAFRLVVAADG